MHEHEHNHNHCHCHEDIHEHNHAGHENHEEHEDGALKNIIIAAVLFALGFVIEHFELSFLNPIFEKLGETSSSAKIVSTVLFCGAFIVCGKDVVKNAVYNLFHGDLFDEQFLMSAASIGAICVGEIPEAVAVMLFYQIGEFFQDYAVDKSKDSISELMKIRPDEAVVLQDGKEIKVDADEVKPGDVMVVRPGERIPVDGIIVSGKSFVDNSSLTGESVPVEVCEGSEVFSGSINKDSVLQIKATKVAEESAASRIIYMVEQSASKKTKTEKFITRFSKVYTPIVCSLAVVVAVVIPFVLKISVPEYFAATGWNEWIYRGLIFLVVSCPCAIVISVPLSFFGGIGLNSRHGILVKGSSAIEGLSKIKTAVFDKTGTLTKGVFVVTEIHSANKEKFPDSELLKIAAHAESYSNHPAAKSLKNAHCEKCCQEVKVSDAQEIAGEGVKVTVDGKTVLAGNETLMLNQKVSDYKKCESEDIGTVVHVAIDGEYAGHIVISDQIKSDSKDAVQALHSAGVKKVVMLTGDSESSAKIVAQETGVDEYYSKLLPEDKVSKVEKLLSELCKDGKKKGTLSFAGDGINDAPVLARSDVGIAMGGLGSDAAIESADVVIMQDEPSKIALAIKNSRRTVSTVYQNIIFSLAVKAIIMLLGSLGYANMWLAVFGDTGVTLLAVLNSMRQMMCVKKR